METELNLETVRAAVRVSMRDEPEREKLDIRSMRQPVVTISRQTGANAAGIAKRLVEVLNQWDTAEQPWIRYERRLVERIAEDHDLSKDLVTRFSERDRSWFQQLKAALKGDSSDTDVAIKTLQTIRALAKVGRAVIVGRSSQCILAEMPNAVHVRLVAPLSWRAEHYAMSAGSEVSQEIENTLERSDAEREKFVRRHFGCDIDDPDHYHAVLNVARIPTEYIVRIIADFVMMRR